MTLKSLPCLLFIAAAVTACQKDPPPAAPEVGATPTTAEVTADSQAAGTVDATPQATDPAWDESAAPLAGTRIAVSPDPVSFCEGQRQAVEVEWDVAAAAPAHLQLWIEDASGQRKLWAATKSLAGSKRTGAWTAEGTRFIVLDGRGDRVINSTTVTAAPCP